jgi:hypothetical protein
MVVGGACILGLIGACIVKFLSPQTWSADGLIAALGGAGVATSYVLIGRFVARRGKQRTSQALRMGLTWGLAAGAMFGLSMLGEYLIAHTNRQGERIALGVFGTFITILFAAGAAGTLASRRVSTGALAGLWSGLIASEIWVLFLFLTYLGFAGTAYESRFLEVDQVIADFRRSGQSNLRVFIFGDYVGGAFFHSVLGALFGLVLGTFGGLAAWLAIRLTRDARREGVIGD